MQHEDDKSDEKNICQAKHQLSPFICKNRQSLAFKYGIGDSGVGNENNYKVDLASYEIFYLVEHLFIYLHQILEGKSYDTLWDEPEGSEQLMIWRLINLMIKSGGIERNDARPMFDRNFNPNELDTDVDLFNYYIDKQYNIYPFPEVARE